MPERVVKWQEVREMEQRAIQAKLDRTMSLDARIGRFEMAVAGFQLVALRYTAFEGGVAEAVLPSLRKTYWPKSYVPKPRVPGLDKPPPIPRGLIKDGMKGQSGLRRLIRDLISDVSGYARKGRNPFSVKSDAVMLGEIIGSTLIIPGPGSTPGGDPIPPSDWDIWPYDMTDSHWFFDPNPGEPNVLFPGAAPWSFTAPGKPFYRVADHDGFESAGNIIGPMSQYDGQSPIDWVDFQTRVDQGYVGQVGVVKDGEFSDAPGSTTYDGQQRDTWYYFPDEVPFVVPDWIGETTEPGEGPTRVYPSVLDPWENHPWAETVRTSSDPYGAGGRTPVWRLFDELVVDQNPGKGPTIGTVPRTAPHRPPIGERERKFKTNMPWKAMSDFIVNIVTENLDLMNALYESMPDAGKPGYVMLHVRGKHDQKDRFGRSDWVTRNTVWVYRGIRLPGGGFRNPTPTEQFNWMYDNIGKIDVDQAFKNIAVNEVIDFAVGKTNKQISKGFRPWYDKTGRPVGVMAGPAM